MEWVRAGTGPANARHPGLLADKVRTRSRLERPDRPVQVGDLMQEIGLLFPDCRLGKAVAGLLIS